MSYGRFVAACAASVAVAGCAVLVIGMSHSGRHHSAHKHAATPVVTARPAVPPGSVLTVQPQAVATASPLRSAPPSTPRPAGPAPTRAPAAAPTSSLAPPPTAAPASTRPVVPRAAPQAAPGKAGTYGTAVHTVVTHAATATPRGRALPLRYTTGSASRVITVVGRSYGGTTARLQAWNKVSSGHWLPYGAAVTAHIGADGMSTHASESRSATPIGSFTLTQAFGHDSNPGTHLPYIHTNRNDWWISQPGRLYNTHQRCSSGCHFTRGNPNEHLYYETPYYNYATVIDYNTRNAPGGVKQGRGSAFFLHVTDGNPTAGCVAIPQSRLVPIMRWLTPSAHPRILIGVS